MKSKHLQTVAWGISGLAIVLAVLAWGESYQWRLWPPSIYKFFPVLGLLAFSLMWGHYISSALRQYFGVETRALSRYFEITSVVVLGAIILHPGLLLWQLWRDGLGLPPGSTKAYVGAAAYWAIWFAIIAWTAFILYEFRRWWGQKKYWPLVQYASDVAIVLIFVHALRLGGALRLDWYRGVWYFYGVTFVVALLYGYYRKIAKQA